MVKLPRDRRKRRAAKIVIPIPMNPASIILGFPLAGRGDTDAVGLAKIVGVADAELSMNGVTVITGVGATVTKGVGVAVGRTVGVGVLVGRGVAEGIGVGEIVVVPLGN